MCFQSSVSLADVVDATPGSAVKADPAVLTCLALGGATAAAIHIAFVAVPVPVPAMGNAYSGLIAYEAQGTPQAG
jgi:hypothetical protein